VTLLLPIGVTAPDTLPIQSVYLGGFHTAPTPPCSSTTGHLPPNGPLRPPRFGGYSKLQTLQIKHLLFSRINLNGITYFASTRKVWVNFCTSRSEGNQLPWVGGNPCPVDINCQGVEYLPPPVVSNPFSCPLPRPASGACGSRRRDQGPSQHQGQKLDGNYCGDRSESIMSNPLAYRRSVPVL